MTDQHRLDESLQHTAHQANEAEEAHAGHREPRICACPADGSVHLLFGSVEELLADLAASGGPEGGSVRVERLVRAQPAALGGTAAFGVALTARRSTEISEVLSTWVIVARVALDLWGRPVSPTQAQEARRRHHEAQNLLSAFVADAGYTPRSGMYLLSEACYGFTATAEPLSSLTHAGTAATGANQAAEQAAEQGDRSVKRETAREDASESNRDTNGADKSEGGAPDA